MFVMTLFFTIGVTQLFVTYQLFVRDRVGFKVRGQYWITSHFQLNYVVATVYFTVIGDFKICISIEDSRHRRIKINLFIMCICFADFKLVYAYDVLKYH